MCSSDDGLADDWAEEEFGEFDREEEEELLKLLGSLAFFSDEDFFSFFFKGGEDFLDLLWESLSSPLPEGDSSVIEEAGTGRGDLVLRFFFPLRFFTSESLLSDSEENNQPN